MYDLIVIGGVLISVNTGFMLCQEVPEGAPDCLAGLTFVISGTLDRYFICY